MVKVAHVLTLAISACLGRHVQLDEEHVKIENPVDSLKTLLTAMNSEFRWHRPTRHYLVARAPLRSRSLGRLRGGDEGDEALDDSDDTGDEEKAPPAPAPAPAPALSDDQKLAKLEYSQADIAKLSPDRIPTILKMNIRRPASGVPRQWCSAGAKKKKATSSKSKGSLSASSKTTLGATGATVLLGALGKLVTGKSQKKPIEEVVVDKELWLDRQYDRLVAFLAPRVPSWPPSWMPRIIVRHPWASLPVIFLAPFESLLLLAIVRWRAVKK